MPVRGRSMRDQMGAAAAVGGPDSMGGPGAFEMGPPPPEAGEAQAVLVFLQGIKEITAVQEALLSTREYAFEPARSWVLPIHSAVPPEEQRLAFARPPPGVRKVVLATNIAETAITIDDVSFVIDCCRMKENRYDATTRMESLEDVPISAANAKQRRGRAGRCRPGVAFHLVTRRTMNAAPSHQAPEVQRMPLDRLILGIKALNYDRPAAAVCAALIEPPSPPPSNAPSRPHRPRGTRTHAAEHRGRRRGRGADARPASVTATG